MPETLSFRAGWPLYLGMTVAAAAAVVASASTLAELARTAGWSSWTPWLLPAALDVGGSVGGWCWLRPGVTERARTFGRTVALTGAAGTLAGNAAGHLIASGYVRPGPVLVVVVGAVPAVVLVALAHLSALLAANPTATTDTASLIDSETQAPESSEVQETQASAGTRSALVAHLQHEPSTVAQLVVRTGRSRSTVVGHLTALADDGVIVRDGDKRYRCTTRPHSVTG